ncbi:MAG: type I restriction enzyme subunit R domain-containing protein [Nocardioidaceae bacterium]
MQHSAGSGKSNTIAWLAHRLSTLHAFVLDKVDALPSRRYAVIVDEAHSSQTGEAAKELRRVLGASRGARRTAGSVDLPADEVEEALAAAVAARGHQHNMSFFAFTATPKGKTLELFGRHNADQARHEPFHVYSMRQAIEERFIHDVLAGCTTYETHFHLENAIVDDPAYQTAQARRAIARFVTLHEHNLAQKAEIVVEHFRAHVEHKIAGQAKAMVVCSSRAHAARMWRALRSHVHDHGYDLGVLVAFSESVDDGEESLTEAKANGFPESQTAERFDTDDYSILVVAEKFQTGIDQPKLYAIYVDKTLTGLAVVQTLSRLNRIHPDKDGTFVLDFVNDAADIADAFAPYYARTRRAAFRSQSAVRHPPRAGRVRRPAHRGCGQLRAPTAAVQAARPCPTARCPGTGHPAVRQPARRRAGPVPRRVAPLRAHLCLPLPDRRLRRHCAGARPSVRQGDPGHGPHRRRLCRRPQPRGGADSPPTRAAVRWFGGPRRRRGRDLDRLLRNGRDQRAGARATVCHHRETQPAVRHRLE